MRPLLLPLLLHWSLISSLPVSEDGQLARQGDCCPCSGTDGLQRSDLDQAAGPGGFQRSDLDNAANTGYPAVLPGPSSPVGCQCSLRAADADTAASLSAPRTVPFRPPTSLQDDVKPLLHPEVDLASSVLETLREATDEEYKDALARDAVRSATRSAEDNLGSPSVVTIILNPADFEDDVLGQGTHTHETRCIQAPLSSSRAANTKTLSSLVRELLRMPVDRNANMLDYRGTPSNIREQVVDSSNVQAVIVKPEIEQKSVSGPQIEPKSVSGPEIVPKSISGPTTPQLPSLIDNVKELASKVRANFEEAAKKMPKLNLPFNKQIDNDYNGQGQVSDTVAPTIAPGPIVQPISENDLVLSDDNCNAPSQIQETIVPNERSSLPNVKENQSVLPKSDFLDKLSPVFPIKLRDADTISKSLLDNIGEKEIKIKVPYLKVKPLFETDTAKSKSNTQSWKLPTLRDLISPNTVSTTESIINSETTTQTVESDIIDTDTVTDGFRTEIIDAIPSASENSEIQSQPERSLNTDNSCQVAESVMKNDETVNAQNKDAILVDEEQAAGDRNGLGEVVYVLDDNEDMNEGDIGAYENNITYEDYGNENYDEIVIDEQEANNAPEMYFINKIENPRDRIQNKNVESSTADSCESETKAVQEQNELPIVNSEESSHSLTSKELQDMADSLLDESRNRAVAIDGGCSDPADAESINVQPLVNDFEDNVTTNPSNDNEHIDVTEPTALSTNTEMNAKSTCDAETLESKTRTISTGNKEVTEMTAEASEPISRTLALPSILDKNNLLGSRLMQSPILQPTLPDIINIFPPLDFNDIFRSNPSLPSLDELRSRISGFLGMNDDDSGMDLDDEQNVNAPLIASPNLTPLSLSRPLEEVDLNLFQLKPLGSSRNGLLSSNTPNGLNMNAFKAKLQVPADLIKPLKLESQNAFRVKDGNVLGAKLSVKPKGKKFRYKSKAKSPLQKDGLLGAPLTALPSLEDIRNAIDPNNILAPSLTLPELQPIGNFRSASPLIELETLKSDASNAFNNLQQSLSSSLNEAKMRHEEILNKPMALRTINVLDTFAKAKSDFNDRLQSIQSDFHEKTNLPRLDTDRLNLIDKLSNGGLNLPRLDLSDLQTKQPNIVTSSRKNIMKNTKPKSSSKRPTQPKLKDSKTANSKFRSNLDEQTKRKPITNSTPASSVNYKKLKSVSKTPNSEKRIGPNVKDSSLAASNSMVNKPAALNTNSRPVFKTKNFGDSMQPQKNPVQMKANNNLQLPLRSSLPNLTGKATEQRDILTLPKLSIDNLKKPHEVIDDLITSPRETLSNLNLPKPGEGILNGFPKKLKETMSSANFKDSFDDRLSSPLKSIKDMTGRASEQMNLLSLPKLSIENMKKPHEVVGDLLTSARETLSNLNVPTPREGIIMSSPEEIKEQLKSTLQNIKTKDAEATQVLSNLRDSIRERFSEIDLPNIGGTGLSGRFTDLTQGASETVKSTGIPSVNSVLDSINDRLNDMNLPLLKSVEDLPTLDLGKLHDPLNILDPENMKSRSNILQTVRDSLATLPTLNPLQGLAGSRLSDLDSRPSNIQDLLEAPAKSVDSVLDKLRSPTKFRLFDPNTPIQTTDVSDFTSSGNTDNSNLFRAPEMTVSKLSNPIKNRLSKLKNNSDMTGSADTLRSSVAGPKRPMKQNVTYRCRMICEEVNDADDQLLK